jgi:hypothetical protein
MDAGVATTPTLVTVGVTAVTVIFAEPDIFVYPVAAEVAVQAAVPAPDGVKTPADEIVPPVAVQVTVDG